MPQGGGLYASLTAEHFLVLSLLCPTPVPVLTEPQGRKQTRPNLGLVNGGGKEGVLGAHGGETSSVWSQGQGSHPQKSCLIKMSPEGQFGDSVPRGGEQYVQRSRGQGQCGMLAELETRRGRGARGLGQPGPTSGSGWESDMVPFGFWEDASGYM